MPAKPRGRRYALNLLGFTLGLLGLSAVSLFFLFDRRAGYRAEDVYGSPLSELAGRPLASGLRPDAPPPLSTGSLGTPEPVPTPATQPSQAAPSPEPAPEPETPATQPGVEPEPEPEPEPDEPDPWLTDLADARALSAQRRWPDALRAYDRLRARRPSDLDLEAERARVLAWSGDAAAAAEALEPVVARRADDAALRLEQARFYWWAGRLERADAAATAALRLDPDHAEALALRTTVRQAAEPSVALAERWVEDGGGPLENLLLARALVRAGRPERAVPHFRAAVDASTLPDSVALELAGAAAGVDSFPAAAHGLERWLIRHPGDAAARARLARAYAWAERPELAIRTYTELLDAADDPALRFERAQVMAWSGRERDAEIELLRVRVREPDHVPSLKLLGDLARWRGDWAGALQYYTFAASLDPAEAAVDEALTEVAERHAAVAPPPEPPPPPLVPDEWRVQVEAFSDSEQFRWLASRATRVWGGAEKSLAVTLQQDAADGAAPAAADPREAGFGAEVEARTALHEHVTASAAAGARAYDGPGTFVTWGAGLRFERDGSLVAAEFRHEPAVRRAVTLAALRAGLVADVLAVTLARPAGAWSLWTRAELERLDAAVGASLRTAGSLAVGRPLGPDVWLSVGLGALFTDGTGPELAGWGPLYWSPEAYVAPNIGVSVRRRFESGLSLAARLNPGYAFIRERADGIRRFDDEHTAVLGAGIDLTFAGGRWDIAVSGDWNGAADASYRSAALRARVSYHPRRR